MNKQNVLDILKTINDPEIPVVNIVDMGIVRTISFYDDNLEIAITPTYPGCPALKTIEILIKNTLQAAGVSSLQVNTVYAPPWSSDDMSQAGKENLQQHGIAPPQAHCDVTGSYHRRAFRDNITCPHCGANDTELRSEFGSTACKSQHSCTVCGEPFEHFKCV